MRIDAHQHFWQYNRIEYDWMSDKMEILKQDHLPSDLKPLLEQIGFEGSIAVQARQLLKETDWLLALSDEYELIKGVVGWVDLRSSEIQLQLEKYAHFEKLKGVRHVVQDEKDDNFVLGTAFQNGIAQLNSYNLTYDLLIFPKQLPASIKLVEKFPEQPFVLDHIAKPDIKNRKVSGWEEDIRTLAGYENVYCKLSGMVTEAEWNNWKAEECKVYLDIIIEAFGTKRVMIGSDWPVCTLCGSYKVVMDIVLNYIQQFDTDTREAIMGNNCAKFYNI